MLTLYSILKHHTHDTCACGATSERPHNSNNDNNDSRLGKRGIDLQRGTNRRESPEQRLQARRDTLSTYRFTAYHAGEPWSDSNVLYSEQTIERAIGKQGTHREQHPRLDTQHYEDCIHMKQPTPYRSVSLSFLFSHSVGAWSFFGVWNKTNKNTNKTNCIQYSNFANCMAHSMIPMSKNSLLLV